MKNKNRDIPRGTMSAKPSYGLDVQSLRGFRLFAVVHDSPCGDTTVWKVFTNPREARKACKVFRSWFPALNAAVLPLEFPRYYFN